MKAPLLLVMGSLFYWNTASTSAQAGSISDTLRTTLIKPYTYQSPGELAAPGFRQIPSAYPVVPDFPALRYLETRHGPQYVSFDLPVSSTQSLSLIIHEIAIVTPGFQVVTSSGKEISMPALKFYAGQVAGDSTSTVAITVSENGMEGLIYGRDYSYTLGKMQHSTSKYLHVVYQTQELPQQKEFNCQTNEFPVLGAVNTQIGTPDRWMALSDCRGVAIYLEADYQLYQDWEGDAVYIVNKILSTFANVAILYANENIRIELSGLKLWDTPDPFVQAGTANQLLMQFKNHWNARGNSFNGDIAHLLSSRISQGGVAYYGISRKNTLSTLNDIAAVFSDDDSRSFAFSASTGMYDSALPDLPAFSYNVYLIAHELGHNFGLPHTHSCLWAGGPIDNCGIVEGGTCTPGPLPPDGGTIMSYCPNLANGFGPQPSAKMKYELLAAQSLIKAGVNPVQITPAVGMANQHQYTTLDVSNCAGTVLWSDGVFSQSSRTLLPTEPTTYYAACSTDGCLSAPGKASLNVLCVRPSNCTLSASSTLSTLHGIALFSFNTLQTENSAGTPSSLGTFYEDFTCSQHTVVKAGETYSFSLSGTFGNSLFAKIYIDYNGNGQFTDANELVYNGLSLFQHSGTIKIPAIALRGTPLRLRVLVNPLLILNACSLPSTLYLFSGKVNDYALTVTDSSCPPNLRESVRSGRWDDPLVWSCSTLPTLQDQVKINAGHYVTLPADFTGYAANVDLQGVFQSGLNSILRIIDP